MPNYSAIWPIGTPPDIILHRSNCCLFCLLFVCVTVGTLLSTQYCQYWLCLKISTLSFHWKALSPGLSLSVVKNLLAKSPSDWCKISSDGVPIGSGTLAGDLGGITIWNPWSNESNANLEDCACTVRVLLFFLINLVKSWFAKTLSSKYVKTIKNQRCPSGLKKFLKPAMFCHWADSFSFVYRGVQG
jgi:hypothetical protein